MERGGRRRDEGTGGRHGEAHDKPRANAIRFQYYQRAYRHIFEAGY